jgi:hypothetical protein
MNICVKRSDTASMQFAVGQFVPVAHPERFQNAQATSLVKRPTSYRAVPRGDTRRYNQTRWRENTKPFRGWGEASL